MNLAWTGMKVNWLHNPCENRAYHIMKNNYKYILYGAIFVDLEGIQIH